MIEPRPVSTSPLSFVVVVVVQFFDNQKLHKSQTGKVWNLVQLKILKIKYVHIYKYYRLYIYIYIYVGVSLKKTS